MSLRDRLPSRLKVLALAIAVASLVAACSGAPSSAVDSTSATGASDNVSPSSSVSVATTPPASQTTTPPTPTPLWITVKYRPDPVNVAAFAYLDGAGSSLVRAAWHDAAHEYLIVDLNGTRYHYCGVSSSTWSGFTSAPSLGTFYNQQLKGQFDCRTGIVPEY